MKNRLVALLISLVLVAGLIIAGCAHPAPTPAPTPGSNPRLQTLTPTPGPTPWLQPLATRPTRLAQPPGRGVVNHQNRQPLVPPVRQALSIPRSDPPPG